MWFCLYVYWYILHNLQKQRSTPPTYSVSYNQLTTCSWANLKCQRMCIHLFNNNRQLPAIKCGNTIYIYTGITIKVTSELQKCGFNCLKPVKRLSLKWSIDTLEALSSGGALMSQECSSRETFTSTLHGGQADEGSVQLEYWWTCIAIPYIEPEQLFKQSKDTWLHLSRCTFTSPYFYINLTFNLRIWHIQDQMCVCKDELDLSKFMRTIQL